MALALLALSSQLPSMARDREGVPADQGDASKPFAPSRWASPEVSAQAEYMNACPRVTVVGQDHLQVEENGMGGCLGVKDSLSHLTLVGQADPRHSPTAGQWGSTPQS